MQSAAKTVPAYLKELPAERRTALAAMRRMIKEAVPEAKEMMQSGMAVYAVGDCPLFGMASQKHHLALYICQWDAMNKFRHKLGKANYGKGCVRFKKLADLSLNAVKELLEDVAARPRCNSSQAKSKR